MHVDETVLEVREVTSIQATVLEDQLDIPWDPGETDATSGW